MSGPNLAAAIATIQNSRRTHVEWRDHWKAIGDHDQCDDCQEQAKLVGDIAHHEECIAGYDNVLAVLHSKSEAVEEFRARAEEEWADSDRREVSAWLTREADQRVRYFPQRRDGVDALIRHLARIVRDLPAGGAS